MKKHLIELSLVALFCLFISGIVIVQLIEYIQLPVVHWSTSEDKCIKILIDDKECPCYADIVNQKYIRIPVK